MNSRKIRMTNAAIAALVANLFLFLTTTTSTTATTTTITTTAVSAQPIASATVQGGGAPPAFPPQWVYNKSEWRSRLYNSMRLTPWQVQVFDGILDARDSAHAPFRDAASKAAESLASTIGEKLSNSTLFKSVAAPLADLQNRTGAAAADVGERALNATEVQLRAASQRVTAAAAAARFANKSSSSSSNGMLPRAGQAAGLAATHAAKLIATALNVSADLVGTELNEFLVVENYREAARLTKMQALSLARAEQEGAFATLGVFQQSVAPVTTPPAPVAGAAASASASASVPALSPEDKAAADKFLAEAAALPKSQEEFSTSTTVVSDDASEGAGVGGGAAGAAATVFATKTTSPVRAARAARQLERQMALEKASASPSSSPPPHPATLVDDSDAEIARWLSEKPHDGAAGEDGGGEEAHLEAVARWISASPEVIEEEEEAAFEDAVDDDAVAAYGAQTQASFAGVAASDAAPIGGIVSPEVKAEARDDKTPRRARVSSRPPSPSPPPPPKSDNLSTSSFRPPMPAHLSASSPPTPSFYRIRYDNGTTARSTFPPAAGGEEPVAALGAPTYPLTSLDAMAFQASPSIKYYYTYLALRAMGFSKSLAATATAATGGGLPPALKYALQAMKIELWDGADAAWVGQSATPFVVPKTGVTYSFARQDNQSSATTVGGGKKKRRLLEADDDEVNGALTADVAAPAGPRVSPSSSSSSTTTRRRRKLFNFGTNTSPPPPPTPPPPGPAPPLPTPGPPKNPAFGSYTPFRADTTLSSKVLNGKTVEPPDAGVCAGDGYVVTMVNSVATIRAQSDPATPLRSVKLFDFFQGVAGDSFGDPSCIFHAGSNRFFAVAYQRTGTLATFIPVAMSSVGDPLGPWTIYRINAWNNADVGLANCNTNTPCFGDYPQIGANEDSIWVTSNQFTQQNNQLTYVGVLITAMGIPSLMKGGAQSLFQTSSTQIFSVKPMTISGTGTSSSTMYLGSLLTSTRVYLLQYTNTNNLASNTPPTLASQRSVVSSVSVGGSRNYNAHPVFADGSPFDSSDERLIGMSYANGRLLASATSSYGPTSSPPRVAVAYWFIDAASATQVYAGLFGDASWNTWSVSTVLDPHNVDRGFICGMIATARGYEPTLFQTASIFGTVERGVGSSNGAVLVSSEEGVFLRGFSNPLRTGDYSASTLDPATGVAWLMSEQGQSYANTTANNWGMVLWKASFT